MLVQQICACARLYVKQRGFRRMSSKKIGQIERPKSLCDIAADAIRDAIITGQYALGTALSEKSLTETLGISKTPVREALALLKHEGLVTVVPQKGTFVFTMSVKDVAQLAQYRYALESSALELSMARDGEALVATFFDICGAMTAASEKGNTAKYLGLDGRFHAAIFEFCGNDFFVEGYHAISGKVAALRTHLSHHPTHTDKSMGEHIEIAEALRDGDIDKASQVLKRHVTRGERTYGDGIEDIALASAAHRKIPRPNRK
ncbi:GntR family transcriptional regulator [Primorskyibacter sedentarius]|uniref:GntR family transcriptional regulator n=1 Tax=Primorskyibacter sedentarius TaxID=745311 RepID=A0A4R3J3W8_9RHOB|nr:GntR family transcriptional regulator [Primorskyibacter sedentarius]TCS58972.1 GntR family transcriptional regulator [Primorskyibacter sedentarius]